MLIVMDSDSILKEVDGYLADSRITETTLGKKAVNDGKAIPRLRAGKRMWPETIQKLRDFMRENPPSQKASGEAA